MGTVEVCLGLGSNVGDREANLRNALHLLSQTVAIETTSSLYDTKPWGYEDQPRFLNAVCLGRTSLSPQHLLEEIKSIERRMGRELIFSGGPRLIDVDILFYGGEIVREMGLEIPHSRLGERAFVLVPLAEIAPDWVHPLLNIKVSEILRRLAGTDEVIEGVDRWAAPISVEGLER